MPAQQLYIKTTATQSPQNGSDPVATGGWVDAYASYGLSMSGTGLSRLMTPAPHKNPIVNKNILSHGESVVSTPDKKDVRQVSLEVHFHAPDEATFWQRYESFCTQVLDPGLINIKTSFRPSVVYHFYYRECTQFTEFRRMKAKFILILNEPHPEQRT